jgi:hypothetical protein
VVVGTALSALLVARSQVGGDQLNLLARGWLWVTEGRFIPYGNPLSTGGKAPGGATTLLAGLPLFLWRDHHAATLAVLACHLLAYFLLDRTLRHILQPHERLLFAVFYWLNPWRVYFSGFLWNPNYLFLAGAVHLSTSWALRQKPTFGSSCAHAAMLVVALQIHPSSLLLVVASTLLAVRRLVRFHWLGVACGVALGNVPLLPWYLDVLHHPALLTAANKGFPFRGLLLVFPLLRGVLYWLRYSSLSLAGRMGIFDFREAFGATGQRWLLPIVFVVTQILSWLTVALAFLANLWLLRGRRHLRPLGAAAPARAWLRDYVLYVLAATILVLSVSPTTFMYWQGLALVHAAVLPLTLWAGAWWRTRRRPLVIRAVALFCTLEMVVALGMAFGSPDYRCRGEETVVFPLRDHSPMFDELHIQETCPWPLDQPGGWWPDVLPESKASSERAR